MLGLAIIALLYLPSVATAVSFDGFDWPFGNRNDTGGWNKNGNGFKNYCPNCTSGSFSYHPGEDWNKNDGLDAGQDVYAIGSGAVKRTGTLSGSLGSFVVIRHDTAKGVRYSVYIHVSQISVSAGSTVTRGQQIAKIYNMSTGPHLHLEIRSAIANDGTGDLYPNDDGTGYYASPASIDANGFLDPSAEISAQRPGTPSVNFYDTPGLNGWTSDGQRAVAWWSISNADEWAAGWDSYPGNPQFNTGGGNMIFDYIGEPDQRQGWHNIYVRAWKNGQAYDLPPSGPYGFDNRAPATWTIRDTPPANAVIKWGGNRQVDWIMTDPHTGIDCWQWWWKEDGSRGGCQPIPDEHEVIGGARIPEGVRTLHVRTQDKIGNFQDWEFGPWLVLPPPPTDLTANLDPVELFVIDLTWEDNSATEAGFVIYRKTPTTQWKFFTSTGPNQTWARDSREYGLQPDTEYSYYVAAFASHGGGYPESEPSNIVTVRTQPSIQNLAATALTSTRVALKWSSNLSNETGFRIQRRIGGGGFAFLKDVAANTELYWDSTVEPGKVYTYRIAALGVGDPLAWSNEATARTMPPVAPSGLIADALSSTRVELKWTDQSPDDIGFSIDRRIGSGAWQFLVRPGAVVKYVDSAAPANQRCSYRVRSLNRVGESAPSNEASVNTLAGPSALAAQSSLSTAVSLNWQDNSIGELGFQVERKAGTEEFRRIDVVGANAQSYVDKSARAEITYTYRVRAYASHSFSNYSNLVQRTPLAAPTTVKAVVVTPTSVRLTWLDNSSREGGFQVERKLKNGSWSLFASVGANVVALTDGTAARNTSYVYRVRAFRGSDLSTFSNEAAVTTPP